MFLADFIFVVSHLKIHPAVHLNTSKSFKKKSLLAFAFLVLNRAKKDKIVAESLDVQIEQRRILI